MIVYRVICNWIIVEGGYLLNLEVQGVIYIFSLLINTIVLISFHIPIIRRQLIILWTDNQIGIGLMVCQQFGGINGICFYIKSIFELAGIIIARSDVIVFLGMKTNYILFFFLVKLITFYILYNLWKHSDSDVIFGFGCVQEFLPRLGLYHMPLFMFKFLLSPPIPAQYLI